MVQLFDWNQKQWARAKKWRKRRPHRVSDEQGRPHPLDAWVKAETGCSSLKEALNLKSAYKQAEGANP